jgi:putative ABC transport system ATP-binding protein
MDKPTAGEIHYNDKRVDNLNEKDLALFRRKEIGFIFQQMHLVPNLSIFENITVPGYLLRRIAPKEVDKRAEKLLSDVGLSDTKNRMPSQLSGGQQQRAATARAMINSPQLIFADEPTGALNSKAGHEILNLMTEINIKGQTIVMVTHDIKAAIRANRIIYIYDGQLAGEMKIEPYTPNSGPDREKQIFSWLTSKGW